MNFLSKFKILFVFIVLCVNANATELFWYANIDVNWDTGGNWYWFDDPATFTGPHQCATSPSSADNVHIYPSSHWIGLGWPAYTYLCEANNMINHVCNDLIIHTGAELTNSTNDNEGSLFVYGNLQCDGDYIHDGTQYLNLVGNGKTISGTGNLFAGGGSPISIGKIVIPEDDIGSYTITSDIQITHLYIVNTGGYKSSLTIDAGVTVTTSYFFQEGTTIINGTLEITGRACTGNEAIAYPGSPSLCGGVAGSKNPYFVSSELTLGANSLISYCSGRHSGYPTWYADFYGGKDQTVSSDITYENLETNANNGYIVTIGDGSTVNINQNFNIINEGTSGGEVSTANDVNIDGDFNLGTTNNGVVLNITSGTRIYGDTGDTFTMGNNSAHNINIAYTNATNTALSGYGTGLSFYGTVTYEGQTSTNQQILCGGANSTYQNLIIDNTATPTLSQNYGVRLNDNTTINGVLTLTDGLLITNGNSLLISSNAGNSLIAGTGNSTFLNSWVNGTITRNTATNTDIYNFPVGTDVNSHLGKLTNANLTGTTQIACSFVSGDPGNADAGLPLFDDGTELKRVNDGGYWIFNPDIQPSGGTYDLELFFNSNTSFTSTLVDQKFTVISRNNGTSDWTLIGSYVLTNVTDSYVKRIGMDSFSHKGIIEADAILPIELLDFYANKKSNLIELNWITISETNNNYFEIQRSTNAKDFITIDIITGAGNSNKIIDYTYNDNNIQESESYYYRLKQVDFDSKFEYSKTISIKNLSIIDDNLLVYPNPSTGKFTITGSNIQEIEILTITGKTIKQIKLQDKTTINNFDLSAYPKGIYMLKIKTRDRITTKKIIIN